MDLFGLTPKSVAERAHLSGGETRMPSLSRSIWFGGLSFCLASLLVFATVAFGERWMYRNLGLPGAYAVWTILFILAGGGALSPLVIGPKRLGRFYLLFSAAFLLYAVGWITAYFILRNRLGEWVGSLAGTILMGLVLALAFGARRVAPRLILILFIANSAGYFLGDFLNNAIGGRAGMMSWGAAFGLGLGAGLGFALFVAQTAVRALLAKGSVVDAGSDA